MKADIYQLWPELDLIKNNELRQRTAHVWTHALNIANMKPQFLHEIPFTKSIKNCSIPFITHKQLVVNVAYNIAKGMHTFLVDYVTQIWILWFRELF